MKRIAVFSFRDILRWAMVPGVVALAAIGNPTIAQGEPINSCFGEVLDYAEAAQIPGDLAVLQKQVFPVAGYASALSLSDDRIPSAAVRQAVAQLTPIYQNCVEERHSRPGSVGRCPHITFSGSRLAVAPISGWDVDLCRVCETA